MSPTKDSARAILDRVLKPYFDRLADQLTEQVRIGTDRVNTEMRQEIRQTGGAVEEAARTVVRDEAATLLASSQIESHSTREVLRSVIDEARGALQLDMARTEDEMRGVVERFRDVFEDFRAKVEPRVVALESRMDSLELRMMTLESEQKDYEGLRARDYAAVQKEAASLRDNLRSDIVELTRMLRMQGDAADQVAEALGRTIARLSAEVDDLGEALVELRSSSEELRQSV